MSCLFDIGIYYIEDFKDKDCKAMFSQLCQ